MPSTEAQDRRYQILQLLGEGSMGQVYLAQDLMQNRQVALKFLTSTHQEAATHFFREEVKLLAKLSHPNLVRIYDYHDSGQGAELCNFSGLKNGEHVPAIKNQPFFSMEHIPVSPNQEKFKELPWKKCVAYFVDLCQGLHYLHSRNILHRDLKTFNVLLSTEGSIKILDFGLATLRGTHSQKGSALGTLIYMPPEAFWGDYDVQSDLFSLGVLFFEMLTGHMPYPKPLSQISSETAPKYSLKKLRPDLPVFFCDLIHRLLEPLAGKRPPSALALIRYLNQHVEPPFELLEEDNFETTLKKLPLVGRERSLEVFSQALEAFSGKTFPVFLSIQGPTGVGRSRFLEEVKWPIQLRGLPFIRIFPQDSTRWLSSLALRFAGEKLTDKQDLRSMSYALLQASVGRPMALAFTDLQDWAAEDLENLSLFLGMARRHSAPLLILMEFRDDLNLGILEGVASGKKLGPHLHLIHLGDLNQEESLKLTLLGTPGVDLDPKIRDKILRGSGGRPLLLIEALRHALSGKIGEVPALPDDFQSISASRVQRLSSEGKFLLAFIASHPAPLEVSQLQELWSHTFGSKESALMELDRLGFTQTRSSEEPYLSLAHPSLRSIFLDSLEGEIKTQAHRAWIKLLTKPFDKETVAGPEAVWICHHALAIGDGETAKPWGTAAALYWERLGKNQEAAWLYERLIPFASKDWDFVLFYAHLAPVYYRLGRFEEALAAYDRWFEHREDNETLLQKIKHLYYTGLVYHAWGKGKKARERLKESLQTGDSFKHPNLRYYHSRAQILLASLSERENDYASAREFLENALKLAEENPILRGEIEQRLGVLAQSRLDYFAAGKHFERALHHYRDAKNPQAEAIALHAMGMLLRDQGKINDALTLIDQSLDLVQKVGGTLQWAQYQENRALVFLDKAEYGKAYASLQEASEVLETLGKEQDRCLAKIHWTQFYLYVGNWHRFRKRAGEIKVLEETLKTLGYWKAWVNLSGEQYLLQDNFGEAEKVFRKLWNDLSGGPLNQELLQAQVGLVRAIFGIRTLKREDSFVSEVLGHLKETKGSLADLWHVFFTFMQQAPEERREKQFKDVLAKIKRSENPEIRMSLYRGLARECRRQGLDRLEKRLMKTAQLEWDNIYNRLPEELKMDFEKNRPLESLNDDLGELLPAEDSPQTPAAQTTNQEKTERKISENRFRQLSEINRQIAKKTKLSEILERLMDASIELTGAERGFLLLKNLTIKNSPMVGFEVKTARHISQGALMEKDFQFSMSAVQEAVDQGSFILTDNAQMDERFQAKKSVVQFQLKSILAFPLEIDGQVLGAIYLDHRFQPGCFSEEDVTVLSAFASQGALAIEKAQMVEELKIAKEKLENKVETQAQHIEVLSSELAQVRDELKYEYSGIIGQAPGMMKVFQMLDHVTETTIPVWISGESGTGKELIAHSLHFNSPRKDGPFVTENCSAIPETLLESELFGHKKGAFTHADRDRVGLFEQASRGTLFLDEIGDMPLSMQAKLLRVLQEGEVRPVGSSKKVKVDVRLVTASHRDLTKMVQEGKFRQDLFYRVNGMTIHLPPLRERKEDIPLLVDHLIKKISKEFNLKPSEMTDEAFQILYRFAWPGNIRELEATIRNALLFAKGRPISPEFLSINPGLMGQTTSVPTALAAEPEPNSEEDSEERQVILEALRKHQMNKSEVAEDLGISLRTLYTRMDKLGIPKKKAVLARYLGF